MKRWSILRDLLALVNERATIAAPTGYGDALRRALLAGQSVCFRREVVTVLPESIGLEGTILLSEESSLLAMVTSITRKRPVFAIEGTLARMAGYFGVDHDPRLLVFLSNSGLTVCFGRRQGADVVVYAAVRKQDAPALEGLLDGTMAGQQVLAELVPDVICAEGSRVVFRRLRGAPFQLAGAAESSLQQAILSALEPLTRIHASGRICSGGPDASLIEDLSIFVGKHPSAAALRPAWNLVSSWDRRNVPAVTVHGDYWLGNVLFHDSQITGIVDWDRARTAGCPAVDALHLGFMSYAMWAGLYVSDVLSGIWSRDWRYSWLSDYCELVCALFSISKADLERAAALLWLTYLLRHPEPSAQWSARMIDPVARALWDYKTNRTQVLAKPRSDRAPLIAAYRSRSIHQ